MSTRALASSRRASARSGPKLRTPRKSSTSAAVVLTNFFPEDAVLGSFEVVGADGRAALASPLACSGRIRGEKSADWGWWFWRADFSRLEVDGNYRARDL